MKNKELNFVTVCETTTSFQERRILVNISEKHLISLLAKFNLIL